MQAIFFAFVSFFGWGISDLFVTISARKLNAYSSGFWSYFLGLILLTFLIPFNIQNLGNLHQNTLILIFFLAVIFMIGLICFREALIAGSSPVMAAVTSSYAVLTTVFSILFFQERLNSSQLFAIVLTFFGLGLTLFDLGELFKGKLIWGKGMLFALMAALSFGTYFTFIKIPVKEIGWFWPNYFSFLFGAPLIFLFVKAKKIKLHKPTYNDALLPLLLAIIFGRIGELAFNLGISRGFSSVVAPIAGANPILFVTLAAIFLRDKVTRRQVLGIVTTLLGVILLSFFSV